MLKTKHEITISPARVAQVLGAVVVLLLLLNVGGQVWTFFFERKYDIGLIEEFNIDRESNIPTYFSSVLLLTAAALLAVIALSKSKANELFARHWGALSAIFLLMSLDEAANLHERLISPLQRLLGASGWFRFAWVIPGMIFVAVLALSYLKFLLHLPKLTKAFFLLAGSLYVGGALGMEMIAGQYADLHGVENFTYSMITTVEEALEMSGVVVFIYALLRYMSMHIPKPCFAVEEPG